MHLANSCPFSPFCRQHEASFSAPYHKQLRNLRGEAHESAALETAAQGFSFTTVPTPLLQSRSSKCHGGIPTSPWPVSLWVSVHLPLQISGGLRGSL